MMMQMSHLGSNVEMRWTFLILRYQNVLVVTTHGVGRECLGIGPEYFIWAGVPQLPGLRLGNVVCIAHVNSCIF